MQLLLDGHGLFERLPRRSRLTLQEQAFADFAQRPIEVQELIVRLWRLGNRLPHDGFRLSNQGFPLGWQAGEDKTVAGVIQSPPDAPVVFSDRKISMAFRQLRNSQLR